MTDAFDQRLIELVFEASELQGEAREQYLQQACAEDERLRREVDSLLAEEAALGDGFLDVPAAVDAAGLQDEGTQTLKMPMKLGPYRLVGTLGEGGMGTVYLAEQDQPVRRRVALKVIDTRFHRGRRKQFKAESQALARLGHPNVASLYEAGTTEDGYPWVAMEWVDGPSVTTWCDHHQRSIEDRLRLFGGVCAGVRHAHEKGVLHRDLKPTNVLVAEVDGQPVAKVIDFGIARAFDTPLVTETRLTPDQVAGSPAYMSPEAALGSLDLDTRSDVYSLGVLLFELLLGELPFDLEGRAVESFLYYTANHDVPSPSSRIASLPAERQTRLAELRGLDGRGLRTRLRGDLDAIVRKACARDRDQRYSSPADLAADIERHLASEPIEARPPSPTYLMGRFLRRRSGPVTAVVLLVLALAAGMVARTIEARRASLQAANARAAQIEAEQISEFLLDLFSVANPEEYPEEALAARQLLDLGASRIHESTELQPLVRARILQTIGEVYTEHAEFEQAEELVGEALAIRSAELPPGHEDRIASLNRLGIVYRRQGRFAEAEQVLAGLLKLRLESEQPNPAATAIAHNNLGNLYWARGLHQKAEQEHRRALEIRQEIDADPTLIADSTNNLAVAIRSQRRYHEAMPYLRQAAELFRTHHGESHPRYAASQLNIAYAEEKIGDWVAARASLERAFASWLKVYGPAHPRTLSAHNSLARFLERSFSWTEAADLWQGMYEIRQREQGDNHHAAVLALARFANAAARADRLTESEAAFVRLQELLATTDFSQPDAATSLMRVGISLGEMSHFGLAAETLTQAHEAMTAAFGPEHPKTLRVLSNQAWLASREGQLEKAEANYRRVAELRSRVLGSDHAATARSLYNLGRSLVRLKKYSEAIEYLTQALLLQEKLLGPEHESVAQTLFWLARAEMEVGNTAEALANASRANEIRCILLPPAHPDLEESAVLLKALEAVQSGQQ